MIKLRMTDGITIKIFEDSLEDFTEKFEVALRTNKAIEIETPKGVLDRKLKIINPHQILYYEIDK